MFVGRTEELSMLRAKFLEESAQIGVVYGQRRIGKTSLINEAIKDKDHLYLLCGDTSTRDNLVHFSSVLADYLSLPSGYVYPSMVDFFQALKEVAKKGTIIFFDELPFLVKVFPSALTLLQGFIDEGMGYGLKLVMSGSDLSFMKQLLQDKKGPLYQRSTFELEVGEMRFSDALKMLRGISNEDAIAYLSLFGGRPLYLSFINKRLGWMENVKALFFSLGGALVHAPVLTLPLNYGRSGVYVGIYEAIAQHRLKQKEIAEFTGVPANNLTTYLEKLLADEVIRKNTYFHGNIRDNYYGFKDPLLEFYYRFVFRNVELVYQGAGNLVFEGKKELIQNYLSTVFERAVNAFLAELNAKGGLGALYHPIKRLVLDNSKLGRSVEFDGLSEAVFDANKLLVVEAKYRNKSTSLEVLNHVKESLGALKPYREVEYYLFSKTGFSRDLLALKDDHVHLFTVDDMIKIASADGKKEA